MEIDDFEPLRGQPWPTLWPAPLQALVAKSVHDALTRGVGHFTGECPTAKGTLKWWDVTVTAIPVEPGQPQRLISVSRDVTQQANAERELRANHERLGLVSSEMAHRVNNTLSLVQAMVAQTVRLSPDPKAFAEKLNGRIAAMAEANRALISNADGNADLASLVRGQLGAYGGEGTHIRIDGPAVTLPTQAASSIALIVHELATNAIKYGALSTEAGRVDLTWSMMPDNGKPKLSLLWQERGGPPVKAPVRRGFGSTLIERGVGGGKVERVFAPDGVTCRIDLPL
jgi:two-component sensor histidine kinase